MTQVGSLEDVHYYLSQELFLTAPLEDGGWYSLFIRSLPKHDLLALVLIHRPLNSFNVYLEAFSHDRLSTCSLLKVWG